MLIRDRPETLSNSLILVHTSVYIRMTVTSRLYQANPVSGDSMGHGSGRSRAGSGVAQDQAHCVVRRAQARQAEDTLDTPDTADDLKSPNS